MTVFLHGTACFLGDVIPMAYFLGTHMPLVFGFETWCGIRTILEAARKKKG